MLPLNKLKKFMLSLENIWKKKYLQMFQLKLELCMEVYSIYLLKYLYVYLGSVNEKNSEVLISQIDVDGFLVNFFFLLYFKYIFRLEVLLWNLNSQESSNIVTILKNKTNFFWKQKSFLKQKLFFSKKIKNFLYLFILFPKTIKNKQNYKKWTQISKLFPFN